jgi:lipopolysaccharide transport system ATP-binding protein
MSEAVIKVENLSKRYLIGHQRQEGYTNLREVIADGAKNLGRKILHPFLSSTNQQNNNSTMEEFYALRDVSFEIKQGDRVGIIGRNGAGKSTLLKLLSRITEPTSGRITLDGRVASLLEVGTGFHPELTGRENIFLNGAVLGMTRAEIRRKFDEIVAFAEVEKFLDTPVKRYSSGMYVRLAFAVAAHLEPEILIIDEVLAVGDAQFQRKCLGKMEEIGGQGRTVLFVSHNMGQVKKLCTKGILIESGQIGFSGSSTDALQRYYNNNINTEKGDDFWRINFPIRDFDNRKIQITDISLFSSGLNLLRTYDKLELIIEFESKIQIKSPSIIVSVKSSEGSEIFRLSNLPISGVPFKVFGKRNKVSLVLDKLPLVGGRYLVSIAFAHEMVETIENYEEILCFFVEPTDVYGSGVMLDDKRGIIAIDHRWCQIE